ncbi:unnamed protein product [Thelazia callipaeda]|uniref:Ribosomal RNA-processing protein 40 n=1 Tax=Thelazia callipaeda TaxID=103827 RepID=A0A158RAN4_THECL|nr:unnamed protein product [Thelazia callipaeda]
MPKKKRKDSECIYELERQLKKFVNQKNHQKTCDLYIEIGDEYRRTANLRNALSYYRKGIQLAEKLSAHENAAFAHRAVAEILVDPSIQQNVQALQHGKKYLDAAKESKNVHFIQLAFHVLGWLHLQIYLNSDEKQQSLLEKGKQWCEKSLDYLAKHALDIDTDKNAVEMGQNSKARKARLQQVLSQICDKMKLQTLSLRYHNAAMAYAVRAVDHDLQYRCLLSKLNFFGDQRLKTAIELVHVAANLNRQSLCEAKYILAQEKIRVKDFVGAKWDLISMLSSKEHEKLDEEEQESFYKILVTVYKTLERIKMLPNADKQLTMKINEKIADTLYEIGFCDISLEFYRQMSANAIKIEDKIRALVSVAETARELELYREAFECYNEVQILENSLDISKVKKAETSICIAVVAAHVNYFSMEQVLNFFRAAESLSVLDHQKKTIYEKMLEYLGANGNCENLRSEIISKLSSICSDKQRSVDNLSLSDEDIETDFVDSWDEVNDTQILFRCNDEANRQSMEERIKSEKDKKINLYGETRMHEAARGSDSQYLKTLIKMGYNVNARDEGGWTPLHEAVGALKLENVEILVQSGANLNLRSNEGTLSADGERTDSGGLTPLMEACDRGATAIVSLLLHSGASIGIKNRDDWTALDFLRNAIKMGMIEDEDMKQAQQLVSVMEKKLEEANIIVKAEPPPKKLKFGPKLKSRTMSNSVQDKLPDPNQGNLLDYRKTMSVVGRGATHNRTNILFDESDIEENGSSENKMNNAKHGRHLISPLDDVLMDNDKLSDSFIYGTESSEALDSLPLSSITIDYCNQQPCTSGINHFTDSLKFSQSEVQPTKKMNRRCKENIVSFSDDSDDELVAYTYTSAQDKKKTKASSTLQNSSNSNISESLKNVQECVIQPSLLSSQDRQRDPIQIVDSASSMSSKVVNQIFIKINFKKNDDTRLKTKGMPFTSPCMIGHIRKRCEDELRGSVEYSSMTICYDDCELSDDTPVELVLTGNNNALDCVLSGWARPSAAQIYAKHSKKLMTNILRAFTESTGGFLDLREMKVGQDDAVCAAVEALETNLIELYLDGNFLSSAFVNLVSKLFRQFTILSVPCCGLESRNLKHWIGDYAVCNKLNKLDLSYNDLSDVGSNYLETVLSLCPNLKYLGLASCNLSRSTADNIIPKIEINYLSLKAMVSLEVLDLSYNSVIDSEHASAPQVESKLEVLNLSLNELSNPADIVQWSLKYCLGMTALDLSATTVSCSIIDLCLRLKADKAPFLTVSLADCDWLEGGVNEIVNTLRTILITSSTVIGCGLERIINDPEHLLVVKPGIRRVSRGKQWMTVHSKRYVPQKGDRVIGIVTSTHGDSYKVDIGSSDLAVISATKRNRPNLKNGDLIYAVVSVATKHLEPELTCIDKENRARGMGILPSGGFMFKTSINHARRLLSPNSKLLSIIGKDIKFEITCGINGRIWVKGVNVAEVATVYRIIKDTECIAESDLPAVVEKHICCLRGFPIPQKSGGNM